MINLEFLHQKEQGRGLRNRKAQIAATVKLLTPEICFSKGIQQRDVVHLIKDLQEDE